MISGLFQLSSSHEWVVTKKTGRASEGDLLNIEKEAAKPAMGLDKLNHVRVWDRCVEDGGFEAETSSTSFSSRSASAQEEEEPVVP